MLNKALGFANELLLSFVVLITTAACSLSNEACFDLGLRRSDLQCTWCDKLVQFELDTILKDSCLSCCGGKSEKETAVKKYPTARLECSVTVLLFLAFVRSDRPKEFSGFSVKYVRGADPLIKLIDAEGNTQEELSIQKWDTDTVMEFLKEHLEED
ncbi:hypothetical protein JTE90_028564 [Oedothorax gibbosus]|uniref:Selenoprotein F n=1 Tax=Oedothorax gibbosus TaxID=931172 RepID=A0AAV6VX98_9ARAC|nr:hypothetical protein JTE90_028564 [Oedothorax gibbosus]